MRNRRNKLGEEAPLSIQCRPEYYPTGTGYEPTGKYTIVAVDKWGDHDVLAHNLPACVSKEVKEVVTNLEREDYGVLSIDTFIPDQPFTGVRFSWEDTDCMGSIASSDKFRIDFTGVYLVRYNTMSDISMIEITVHLPGETYTAWVKVPGPISRVGDHIADLCVHLHTMKGDYGYDRLKLQLFQHIFNCSVMPSVEGTLVNSQWRSLEEIIQKLEENGPKSAFLLYGAGIIYNSLHRVKPTEELYSAMADANRQSSFLKLHKFLTNRYEGEKFVFNQ